LVARPPTITATTRIACGSLCFSRLPFQQACAQIARLGFRSVDIAVMENWAHFNPSRLVENLEDAVAAAQSAVERHGLIPVAFNASAGASDAAHEPPRFRAICAFAQALAVPVVCYVAPLEVVGLERAVRRYEPLLAIAEEHGLTLAVEAHARTLLERPEAAVAFCEALPGIALTLDPSHMYAGPNEGAPFDALYRLTRHTHWRDSGRSWERVQLPVGEGDVDFEGVVRGLRAAGYRGAFSVEYIDTFPNGGPGHVVEMRDRLRSLVTG
jgi:sugar phosphate isomerase/epimerase